MQLFNSKNNNKRLEKLFVQQFNLKNKQCHRNNNFSFNFNMDDFLIK